MLYLHDYRYFHEFFDCFFVEASLFDREITPPEEYIHLIYTNRYYHKRNANKIEDINLIVDRTGPTDIPQENHYVRLAFRTIVSPSIPVRCYHFYRNILIFCAASSNLENIRWYAVQRWQEKFAAKIWPEIEAGSVGKYVERKIRSIDGPFNFQILFLNDSRVWIFSVSPARRIYEDG